MNVNNEWTTPVFDCDRPINTTHLRAALAEVEIFTQEIDHEDAG